MAPNRTGEHKERDAMRRLKLPDPDTWTVSQYREAMACTGCTVEVLASGTRVTYAVTGCPAHASDKTERAA